MYGLDLLESGLFICGNGKANEENMMTGFECICCWALLLFVIVHSIALHCTLVQTVDSLQ